MVECTACGQRCERGEQFCGSCGAYLDWSEETAPAAPSAAAPASAPTAPPAPTTPPTPASAPVAAATEQPAPEEPVAAPVQPLAAGPVPPPRPTVVRPPDEPPPAPGDLVCGQCGVGNVPTRRFCRRCGASLADAPAAPRPSWWRRLTTRSPRQAPAAGERPAPSRWRRMRRPRLLVPVVIVALGLAAFGLRGQIGGATDKVRDRVAKGSQIHPVGVKASSSAPGHAAGLAVDGTTDRYWAPAAGGAAAGQYLEATFEQPFRLLDVVIHPGASPVDEQFLKQARPHDVVVTTTDSHGTSTAHTLHLADSPGPQTFHLAVSDVTRIRVTLQTAYATSGSRHVAVAELEFFKR
ncbi:NADase-type glycan-binding domain-containing protein [Streptomyces sp. NPDC049040]|uniref:NADase-type glycan-binding domain-containing protein n=1 Tax=Streptomyces sp. NPDC049040 TaxID=3365593 RepID=UPI003720F528